MNKGTNPEVDSYSAVYENDGRSKPRFPDGKTLTETFNEKGIKKVVLYGLAFDYCVGFTALDLIKDGFEVTLIKDFTKAIALPSDDEEKAKAGITTEDEMTEKLLAAGVKIVNSKDFSPSNI